MAVALSLQDTRVEDYLNDKLQTNADLESLDGLLRDVQHQQSLLKEQLSEAQETVVKSTEAFETHTATVLQKARAFKKQQADVDRRLLIVTRSETSDDAVQKFDEDVKDLQRLEVARSYIELLAEVEQLSTEARRNFKTSPQAALEPYLGLQKLAIALKEAQPAAEDAAPHLVDHVDQTAQGLWKQMKDAFGGDFEKTLTKMKWPGKDITLAGALEEEWIEGVKRLLELQEPELKAQSDQVEPLREPVVLLPLEVMTKPLDLRFQYHFSGDRPTNKLDKPEYFLSHFMGLLDTYDDFFAIHLQPILVDQFRKSNLAMTSIFIDSTSALITALLPMLRRKVFDVMPHIAKQSQLLSHTIHELMNLDISLREEWGYDGGRGVEGWGGLTWEVLVKKNWFGRWFEVEKNFALSRYHSITEPATSFEIDYDSVEPAATKPTNAAIRVNDLLETITDRYRPLPSFSQKMKFLILIQLEIFDSFHSVLANSLESYLSLTSPIARTVHGTKTQSVADVEGLSGIERLVRVYGSAEYLEKKMRDWSDDVFFLELWEELQERANDPERGDRGMVTVGDMSVEHVADKTSSAVGNEAEQGALFDECAGSYRRLRIRTEGVLTDSFVQQVRESLRPYGKVNAWSTLSSPSANQETTNLAISSALDAPFRLLNSYLEFLSHALAQAPLRRIVRQVLLSMQAFLWDQVLMRYSFSVSGAEQFARDVRGVREVVDAWVGRGQGEMGMRRVAEGCVLLGLRVKSNGEGEAELSLGDAEERLFRSNEDGREVLEELGLETLSESEARGVLERRVDLGG
ncbi:MAG: hypothetical protein LQ352_000501 [Teloschistes flavicans]|nr:MAG: hypothetical protein LQ352_000501 [Teloschistes flavicans]